MKKRKIQITILGNNSCKNTDKKTILGVLTLSI